MTEAILISITKFADEIKNKVVQYDIDNNIQDNYGSEAERITCYIARVSNPNNQLNNEIEKLLKYCLDNGHVSVFEHVYLTIEVKTTIDISRQILRHRSFTFQEYSTRYASVTKYNKTPFVVPRYRRQDKKNRQNSTDDLDEQLRIGFEKRTQEIFDQTEQLYNDMLEAGVAKETARRIIPLCTDTTIYMTGNIRSWIFWLKSRLDPSTQFEHREITYMCQEIFKKECPIISKALGW